MSDLAFVDERGRRHALRPARPSDAPAIQQIRERIAEEGIYYAHESFEGGAAEVERDIGHAGQTGSLFLVVEGEEGQVVGYGQLRRYPLARMRHVAALSIFLLPKARNAGVGKRTVAHMLDWAGTSGIAKVALSVHALNERAIRLYEEAGFEREGLFKRELLIDGEYVDSVKMCKFLDR